MAVGLGRIESSVNGKVRRKILRDVCMDTPGKGK